MLAMQRFAEVLRKRRLREAPMRRPILMCLLCVAVAGKPAIGQTCVGDCDDDGEVEINELISGVNILVGALGISACSSLDNGQGEVTVDRLIAAVNNALCGCEGCSSSPTATPTPTGTTVTPTPT